LAYWDWLALLGHPRIADAVLVVVGVRTTVGVLESVPVFRIVGTLVLRIVNPVFIVVVVWTSVFVFESVLVFGNVGALIYVVGNAVAVAIAHQCLHHFFGDEADIGAVLALGFAGGNRLDKVIKVRPRRGNKHRLFLDVCLVHHRVRIEREPIHIYIVENDTRLLCLWSDVNAVLLVFHEDVVADKNFGAVSAEDRAVAVFQDDIVID